MESWPTTDLREGREAAAAVGNIGSVADGPARRRVGKELARSESVLSALATRRTIRYGRDDPEALRHRHHLANVYVAQGRLERAKSLLEDVVSRRARVEGADGALTLAALGDLAGIQRLRGDIPGFLATAERVVNGCVRTLAEGDPQTFAARLQLAFALHETGQLEPARALLRELLDSPVANDVEPDVRRRAQRVLGSVLT